MEEERQAAGYKGALSYKDENGKTKRYVAYGRTRKDVRDKLDKARERLTAGAPVQDAKQTVGDWLAHWRVTGAGGIRPQGVDARRCTRTCPVSTWSRHRSAPSRWTGSSRATSTRWCWR